MDSGELAGYRVEGLIGRGGMAFVYRAVDERLGRTVALKVLSPELSTDEGFRKRFLRESRTAASIDHPNVIPIYDAGEADDVLYIAMRYVEGRDLKALLAEEGRLSADRTVEIFSQVADALDAAHAHGLVHRDVKPANILIATGARAQRHEHIYLSDFGLTKRASSLSGFTAPGVIIGTMDYLAPEQIGGKPVSARTDVYALGCVIYQALTGSVPFVRDDDAALLWAHLMETLPPVAAARPDLPAGVQGVLAKATAKDPEDRYASCGEFLAELTTLLRAHPPAKAHGRYAPSTGAAAGPPIPAGTDTVTARAPGPTTAGRRLVAVTGMRPRRRGRLWATLAAILVLVLVAAGIVVLKSRGEKLTHFAGNNVLPLSFDYPTKWQQLNDGGYQMVVSPHANVFLPLFTRQPGAWADAARVLRTEPDKAIGMYTFFNTSDYTNSSSEDLSRTLTANLPDRPKLQLPRKAVVGGKPADRLDGRLSDPGGGPSELSISYYVLPTDGRTIHLIFFAPAASFRDHQHTFEAIVNSVGEPG
jgi:hypothetical protein